MKWLDHLTQYPGEHEMALQRGSKFVITNVEYAAKKKQVHDHDEAYWAGEVSGWLNDIQVVVYSRDAIKILSTEALLTYDNYRRGVRLAQIHLFVKVRGYVLGGENCPPD